MHLQQPGFFELDFTAEFRDLEEPRGKACPIVILVASVDATPPPALPDAPGTVRANRMGK
jgi:hypothetical protein